MVTFILYHSYVVYSVPLFYLNESSGHLVIVSEYKGTEGYFGSTLGKYGFFNVGELFVSATPSLDSIKVCEDCYITSWGNTHILESHEAHPWNYFSYRTIARQ